MVEHKLKKKDLRDIIAMGNIKLRCGIRSRCSLGISDLLSNCHSLRDGCDALISLLNSSGVPMVILSAGIAGM